LDLVDLKHYSRADIERRLESLKEFPLRDDARFELGHKAGGRFWSSMEVKLMRNVATQMIRDLGKKLLSGTLNLTTVSFPIKAMIPRSALETSLIGSNFL
jgi:hypothetical protein